MVLDVYLAKKGLLRTENKTVNVADLVRRNEFERKQEKKRSLFFISAALSTLVISLFVISL